MLVDAAPHLAESEGDVIDVELQPVTGKKVRQVAFDRVLMVSGEGGDGSLQPPSR